MAGPMMTMVGIQVFDPFLAFADPARKDDRHA
jgi:hypothetical protein